MTKRWILTLFILLVVSYLVWGQTNWCFATKEERHWFIKILNKMEEVLDNQKAMLKEIKALKEPEKKNRKW